MSVQTPGTSTSSEASQAAAHLAECKRLFERAADRPSELRHYVIFRAAHDTPSRYWNLIGPKGATSICALGPSDIDIENIGAGCFFTFGDVAAGQVEFQRFLELAAAAVPLIEQMRGGGGVIGQSPHNQASVLLANIYRLHTAGELKHVQSEWGRLCQSDADDMHFLNCNLALSWQFEPNRWEMARENYERMPDGHHLAFPHTRHGRLLCDVFSAAALAIGVELAAVNAPEFESATTGGNGKIVPPARHSIDFRSVDWFGTKHTFTPNQAACVRVLWEAWENGTPELSDGTILEKAGAGDTKRMRDVFKLSGNSMHSAWDEMIVRGNHKDTLRLNEPQNNSEIPAPPPT